VSNVLTKEDVMEVHSNEARIRAYGRMEVFDRWARIYGMLGAVFLFASGSLVWLTDNPMAPGVSWSLLCVGIFSGFQWIKYEMEIVREKLGLRIELGFLVDRDNRSSR
jgi:hypothetical protein